MSNTVKLASGLPSDFDLNGIDQQRPALVTNPETTRVAIIWYDVAKIGIDVDTGSRTPTIRIRRAEPLGDVDTIPDDIRKLVEEATEKRTGRVPLPFDEIEVLEP